MTYEVDVFDPEWLRQAAAEERAQERNQHALQLRQYNPRANRSRMLHEDVLTGRFVLGLRVHDRDLGWIERRIDVMAFELQSSPKGPRPVMARYWRTLRRAMKAALL